MEQTISEADILSDLISPEEGDFSVAGAESILGIGFRPGAKTRLTQLAEKNSEGNLTPAEKEELDKYLRVGNFLNLIQAKARLSLVRAGKMTLHEG